MGVREMSVILIRELGPEHGTFGGSCSLTSILTVSQGSWGTKEAPGSALTSQARVLVPEVEAKWSGDRWRVKAQVGGVALGLCHGLLS